MTSEEDKRRFEIDFPCEKCLFNRRHKGWVIDVALFVECLTCGKTLQMEERKNEKKYDGRTGSLHREVREGYFVNEKLKSGKIIRYDVKGNVIKKIKRGMREGDLSENPETYEEEIK